MEHMYVPERILPIRICLSGFPIIFLIMMICLIRLKGMGAKRDIPLLGAVSAAIMAAMKLEILPLTHHNNLPVVASINLGPALRFPATFYYKPRAGARGAQGGMTVIGLNMLLLGAAEDACQRADLNNEKVF